MGRIKPSWSGTIKVATETRVSWKHIRDVIHGRILNSTYAAGDKLPKDEHLALELGCSRATVQRAMHDLAEGGSVERRRKGGTCVRRDPVTRATLNIPITRLEVEQRGAVYSYQFIRKAVTRPPLAVASRLGLQGQIPLLRIEALHLADHRPYIYEDRWICQATVPEIEEVDLNTKSANEWLVRNKPFSRCDIRFYARKTDARLSEILDAEDQEALFVMERTAWINDDPITSVTAVTYPGYQLLTTI